MYIKYAKDGSIESSANHQFPGSQKVSFEVVRGYDGKLYEKGKEPQKTPEQERAEQVAAERARLCAELDSLDAKGARAARAVALALVNGDLAASADVDKLLEIEEQARALREEMGAL